MTDSYVFLFNHALIIARWSIKNRYGKIERLIIYYYRYYEHLSFCIWQDIQLSIFSLTFCLVYRNHRKCNDKTLYSQLSTFIRSALRVVEFNAARHFVLPNCGNVNNSLSKTHANVEKK